ncbi:Carbohydrate esterase family 9 protein [Mycena venus]|uniref:Carbohydrate esterase family 9 protein n=1 Tax=Mycena venus TaxID=2733690 RepID=A0A8H7CAC1_9AGAR|nr:Carbohydrate esterase family 9 protein [Mycena venus]
MDLKKSHMSAPIRPPKSGQRFQVGRSQLLALLALLLASNFAIFGLFYQPQRWTEVPLHSEITLARCRALNAKPGPPPSFNRRTQSDRFQPGTRAVLVKNATIWTGRVDGLEVLRGDIFMDGGIIVAVGVVEKSVLDSHEHDVVDAQGAWVTPGIIDMHSHLAVGASPQLLGANDGNSLKGLVLPFLRALDAMNTHDEGFALAVAGGRHNEFDLARLSRCNGYVGFVIKIRPTKERSSSALLLEPPFGINGSEVDYNVPPRWRHMKHACGENPARLYDGTRMDTVWSVRKAYDEARKMKISQDEYCEKALAGQWTGLGDFPSELALEALVDVLRGKFKVQTHCYEAVDIDAFIRMSNEFQFPVASFHHAHESYLVPEVLKRGYGHPPASAIFSTFARYKREAYRHSEFAPRILADNGLKVIMKSDHSAIVSRYLIHEARLAHYYGLSTNLALASVTSTPAEVLGLDHRIGFVKPGYDADIVVWDSHPLAISATPSQVFIDGIPQLVKPHISKKPASQQRAPSTPDFEKEIKATIQHEGLPPLEPATRISGPVLFRNVSSLWSQSESGEVRMAQADGNVLVKDGAIVWSGSDAELSLTLVEGAITVDLQGGSISPALVSAGSALGLHEIAMEESTADGAVFDPLSMNLPSMLGQTLPRAADGLQFGTRDALLAYRGGVASAVTAPAGDGMFQGLSVSFSLGSRNKLEKGAIFQEIVAIHISISLRFASSVSTQIATLRRLLLEPPKNEHEFGFQQAGEGVIPLVIAVNSADVMANLLLLKKEVETYYGQTMKMTFVGGAEAHLLAAEIAEAGVGVILAPPRSFPYTWEHRRILAGPPLTEQSSAALLASHGVIVGLGPQGVSPEAPSMSTWAVRNLRFDMAWVALESGGSVSKEAALAMASSNIEKLLGVQSRASEFAVTQGGDLFSLDSKVIAMVSSKRGVVDLF